MSRLALTRDGLTHPGTASRVRSERDTGKSGSNGSAQIGPDLAWVSTRATRHQRPALAVTPTPPDPRPRRSPTSVEHSHLPPSTQRKEPSAPPHLSELKTPGYGICIQRRRLRPRYDATFETQRSPKTQASPDRRRRTHRPDSLIQSSSLTGAGFLPRVSGICRGPHRAATGPREELMALSACSSLVACGAATVRAIRISWALTSSP